MRPTDLAATVIRQKVTGEKPAPISPWRVGMPINLDETPFILADDKLVTPKPGSDKGYVAAVGRLRHNTASLVRLYLDGTTFLQADLNPKGDTAELWRLFRQLDVVNPTTADDWEQWLGAEGMIGWPTFQTKDGVVFTERVWAPSESRIAPFDFQETVEGDREPAKHTMMLYARSTGLADPAPQVEYALLELVERDGKRWIEIHAGIDVSPASLGII